MDIRDGVAALGLRIRAGVHTGEVEVVPGGLRGVAVHEAARIMGLAAGGEVLVSELTMELTQGGGLSFEDRGAHQLKGLEGTRRVSSPRRDTSTDKRRADRIRPWPQERWSQPPDDDHGQMALLDF